MRLPNSAPLVYFSAKTREDLYELLIGAEPRDGIRMGYTHYTHKIVARRFLKLLAQNGISARELDYPEMQHASTLPDCASTTGKPLHLIFKPVEEIRILRGAYNIGIVYWEFDRITTTSTTGNPSSNQFRMLSLLDEIWVANRHLKQVLEDAGLRNVHCVPCPVETAEPGSNASRLPNWLGDTDANVLQFKDGGWPITSVLLRDALPDDAGTDACPIFLSIFNPNDMRKDFETLLRGFLAVRLTPGQQPTLLIKLIVENVETSLDTIWNFQNWKTFGSAQHKNIVCFSKSITDQEMAELYRSCQYYLSVSRGEGQNLPLIEAIGYGCMAVSPNHTSMADYINPDTAIVVPSEPKRADPTSNSFKSSEFFWHQSDPEIVGRCIETALRLTVDDRERIVRSAQAKTAKLYSPAAVWSALASRLEALR